MTGLSTLLIYSEDGLQQLELTRSGEQIEVSIGDAAYSGSLRLGKHEQQALHSWLGIMLGDE